MMKKLIIKCGDIGVGNVHFDLEVLNKHVGYASPISIIML